MGIKYLIRYMMLVTVLLMVTGTSLGQIANSNYDYLGTPVYYSNTPRVPGMPYSQPMYIAPYPSSYYTNQLNYSGGNSLGTPIYYSNTQHLPGMPLSQPAYFAPYTSSYYGQGFAGPNYYSNPYYYNNPYYYGTPNYYGNYPYSTYAYNSYLTGFGLTGRVVDQSGNGIPGAQVILSNVYEGGTFSTTTNAQGFYGINAPDGVYYVTASRPGYSFSQSIGTMRSGFVFAPLNIIGYPTATGTSSSMYGMPATGSSSAAQSTGSYNPGAGGY